MRILNVILTALVLTLSMGVSAQARDLKDTQSLLKNWFKGFEFVPTEQQFAQVGPHLEEALVRLALTEQEAIVVRARAVSAMVYAPGKAAETALIGLAQAQRAESLLRRKAILVVGEAFGAKYLDLVASVFGSAPDDVPLREACARALLEMGEPAYQVRQVLLTLEREPSVRAILAEKKAIR